MTDAVLDVRGLTVGLANGADVRRIIGNIDITVPRGEIVCVVGESGSGKSVTAFSVMGLLPDGLKTVGGSIKLLGEELVGAPDARMRALRGSRIGMIFQEPMTALNPVMTVREQLAELIEWHSDVRPSKSEVNKRVLAALEDMLMPNAAQMMHAYPHQLSGGQRQRVMIAMAMLLEPVLLIADEPTTALDVTTQKQILMLIKDLVKRKNIGVLFITHDFGVVADIADKVVVMQKGAVVESGSVGAILGNPAQTYTRLLIDSVPKGIHIAEPTREPTSDVLAVKGLKMTYGHRGLFGRGRVTHAVRDAGFTLGRGEILGVVGESGSGKSTLARCVARLMKPTSGEINLLGTDIASVSNETLRSHRRYVQVVFQDPYRSLNPRLSVGQSMIEGVVNFGASLQVAREKVAALLELVGMDPHVMHRFPHEFSGGQRQRICIARALASEPQILIADEAVSALDVTVQAQVLKLFADLRSRLGLAMLFITHDLRVAGELCDRIMVMKSGEIVESGWTAEIFANPQHAYTKALFAAAPGRERLQ